MKPNEEAAAISRAELAAPGKELQAVRAERAKFFNRESSWLEFNRRVLHEALDPRTPLLERVGFLAIFTSNLDEYYQKRVGGLKRQIDLGVVSRTPDGMMPEDMLKLIREKVLPMLKQQADCYEKIIKPALAKNGIHMLNWNELTEHGKHLARDYFKKNLFPVLTPIAVDPGHPFPFISNLSTSLGVMLRNPNDPVRESTSEFSTDPEDMGMQFARVKVPAVLPGWIKLKNPNHMTSGQEDEFRFINLEDLITHNLDELFRGMEIVEVESFRITRNADVERDEEDAEDLLELISQELRDRRFARAVRLEVQHDPYKPIHRVLSHQLNLKQDDVYEMPSLLDYTDLWIINGLNVPELKYKPWTPMTPPRLADEDSDIFNIIRAGDVLVHHPYDSFGSSVERFIKAAAKDPKVVTIKLTLYRTDKDSPFLPELIKAAEMGKQVVVLVELKARFDEERNVQLARQLEQAGVHVVYGVVGLKTHTKTALVVRHEEDGMRCYAHIGTGNYNSKTAKLYTDLGIFTCDPRLTNDLIEVFHFITGRSIKTDFDHLLIAPINMRRRFMEMIDREIGYCEAWKSRGADPEDPNRPTIIAKMNSLEDKILINKLYDASQAGVRVKLIVRGFCSLRPGVKDLSENITVTSIIGRFLEHSRIYHFHNDGNHEYYIGSADWMYRNLNNRVECIAPIYDLTLQKKLQLILDVSLNDQRQAWDLQPDGTYIQRQPDPNDTTTGIGTQQLLMDHTRQESASVNL
ncbi:polyphosphate kinase 1 [Poriferisphaera sp. WC338]|uniref:polyphosphate kinase 1 n=1 Tax=Poriferisphaera sp. WC338 TaxID=3425129 RepID=UPI003D813364